VSDIVKETIAAVGENIQIRRFIKFKLGEGMEKKNNDFAAEVAQQTQAKVSAPKAEESKKEVTVAAKAVVQVLYQGSKIDCKLK
jgi:elongation factor Ts